MTDETPGMYHDGHRELQDLFDGRRLADALEKSVAHKVFTREDAAFIEGAEFFFLATAFGESVDCSFKGGPPGFVRVTGPNALEWTDLDGNSMYRSLGNILKSPRVGLLFIEFGPSPRRLRVNGTCQMRDIEGSAKPVLRVEAEDIFPNCPRYIPDLSQGTASPYLPADGGIGPKPGWKAIDGLSEALPDNDPHRLD